MNNQPLQTLGFSLHIPPLVSIRLPFFFLPSTTTPGVTPDPASCMVHLLAHNVCLSNLFCRYFLVSTLPSLSDLGV